MNTESESFELTVSKSQMVLNRLTEFACVCVGGSQGCLHALTLFCATSAVSPVRCNPHTGVVVHAKKSFCGHTVQKLVHRCKYQMDRAMSFLHFNGMFVFLLLVCKFAHNCTSRGLDVCM